MVTERNERGNGWTQVLYIVIVGLGIGWLIGLSASPVVAAVVSTLLGVGAGAATGYHSIRRADQAEESATSMLDARPAAFLVIGIAVAATCGMVARSHRVFEPAVVREAAWRLAAAGQLANSSETSAYSALLFKVTQTECEALLSLEDNNDAFLFTLARSSIPGAEQLVSRIDNPDTLRSVVEALCARR